MIRYRPRARRRPLSPLATTAPVVASGLLAACVIVPALAAQVFATPAHAVGRAKAGVAQTSTPATAATAPRARARTAGARAARVARARAFARLALARSAGANTSAPATSTEAALLVRKSERLAPPSWLLSQGTVSVPAGGRQIALTFDDGPSQNTLAVLQVLARFRAHATFFCIGVRAQGKAAKLRAILGEGSEIGNHTYRHVSLIGHGLVWDEAQISRTQSVIESEAGVRPRWVRPEGGWLDQTGMDSIHALHMRFAYWNDPGEDTVRSFTAGMIAEKVLEHAQPGGIIVLHETNPSSVQALPRILEVLTARGYTVTSLSGAFAR